MPLPWHCACDNIHLTPSCPGWHGAALGTDSGQGVAVPSVYSSCTALTGSFQLLPSADLSVTTVSQNPLGQPRTPNIPRHGHSWSPILFMGKLRHKVAMPRTHNVGVSRVCILHLLRTQPTEESGAHRQVPPQPEAPVTLGITVAMRAVGASGMGCKAKIPHRGRQDHVQCWGAHARPPFQILPLPIMGQLCPAQDPWCSQGPSGHVHA